VQWDFPFCPQGDPLMAPLHGGRLENPARLGLYARPAAVRAAYLHSRRPELSLTRTDLSPAPHPGLYTLPWPHRAWRASRIWRANLNDVNGASYCWVTVLVELMSSHGALKTIGCEEHSRGMTRTIITFYLNSRMHFVCAQANRATAETNRRKRNMAKLANLGVARQSQQQ